MYNDSKQVRAILAAMSIERPIHRAETEVLDEAGVFALDHNHPDGQRILVDPTRLSKAQDAPAGIYLSTIRPSIDYPVFASVTNQSDGPILTVESDPTMVICGSELQKASILTRMQYPRQQHDISDRLTANGLGAPGPFINAVDENKIRCEMSWQNLLQTGANTRFVFTYWQDEEHLDRMYGFRVPYKRKQYLTLGVSPSGLGESAGFELMVNQGRDVRALFHQQVASLKTDRVYHAAG